MRTKIFVMTGILSIIAAAAFAGSLDQTASPTSAGGGAMYTFWGLNTAIGVWGLQTGTGVPAPVPKTGDSTDGATGVNFPSPRFTVNAACTVTDNLMGRMWLKDANCANAPRNWATAKTDVVSLNTAGTMNSNNCSDTSNVGSHQTDWRLPTQRELQSLIHCGYFSPALSNTVGTGQWTAGNPFDNVQTGTYCSATTVAADPALAWVVFLYVGSVGYNDKSDTNYVWTVRGGQ